MPGIWITHSDNALRKTKINTAKGVAAHERKTGERARTGRRQIRQIGQEQRARKSFSQHATNTYRSRSRAQSKGGFR